MKKYVWAVVAVAIAVIAVVAYLYVAQEDTADMVAEGPNQIVVERQEMMKQNGASLTRIVKFVQEGEGTLADVTEAAETILANAGRIPDMFPEGTSMDEVPNPRNGARPVIWTEWDGFVAASLNLQQEAEAMRDFAAQGNAEGVAAQLATLGERGCGGCHRTYRQQLD